LYLLHTFLYLASGAGPQAGVTHSFKQVSLALVCLGFPVLLLEAGRPLRGGFLLRGLGHSWMSREVLSGAIFVLAAGLDLWFSKSWLWVLATIAAMALIGSQGFILYRARGVCGWNRATVPLLFASSALTLAGGLTLVLAWAEGTACKGLLATNLVLVGLDLAVWLSYVRSLEGEAFSTPAFVSRQRLLRAFIILVGHAAPLVSLSAALVVPAADQLTALMAGPAGVCVVAGGIALKVHLLRGVAFLRELALAGEPTLGEGGRCDHVSC